MEIMMARTAALKAEQVSADSKPTVDAFTRNIGFTPNMTATFALSLTNPFRLQIAEKGAGSLNFLALLRWALVIIFLWFGGMKFTAYEAAGIAPFIEHSPIMSWLHALFGVQGASYVIGVIELSTATALILGAFQPIFSALGAAMSAATYLTTLTFFLSTPGVAEATAGGFPAISAAPGQFLLKDLVLLAASLSLLFASVQGPWLNVQKS
jgi:reactive chlorine resistance protein C